MDNLLFELWLRETGRLSARRILEARQHFGSAEQAYRAVEAGEGPGFFQKGELAALRDLSLERPRQVLAQCAKEQIQVLGYEDPLYPQPLRQIYDPPAVLYVRGTLPDFVGQPSLAIVGQRRAGDRGMENARRFAHVLSAHGFVIVSGLAYGIDSAAHRGALDGPSPTVAVFGTAIDKCYPASHNGLLRQVLQQGAAVSEYAPGTPGHPGYFPQRNRIISGLTLGTLVAEAPRHSGSLITASTALEQGRDVFAIPGDIDRLEYQGCNELIRAGGAALCSDPVQICQEYASRFPGLVAGLEPLDSSASRRKPARQQAPEQQAASPPPQQPDPRKLASLTPREAAIAQAIQGRTHIDLICQRTDLPAAQALSSLTMMQIKGIVKDCGAKYFEIL